MQPQTAIDKSQLVARLKTKTIGKQLRIYEELTSTNDKIREFAEAGADEGLAILANEQTGGRGRLSRKWDSPPNMGLWFSILLRPNLNLKKSGLLPLTAAVAVADGIERELAIKPQTKWPNDLLLQGKKFCGILSEAKIIEDNFKFIILGIGINLNQKLQNFPDTFRSHATSLSLHVNKKIDKTALLAKILESFEKWYHELAKKRFNSILKEWKTRCAHLGSQVKIVTPNEEITGIAEDISKNGLLLLRTQDGERKEILAGDCHLLI